MTTTTSNEITEHDESFSSSDRSVGDLSEHEESSSSSVSDNESVSDDFYLYDYEEAMINGKFLNLLLKISSNDKSLTFLDFGKLRDDETYVDFFYDDDDEIVELDLQKVKCVIQALKTNTTITSICLSNNSIGDDGIVALSAVLQNMPTRDLYLMNSGIGNKGMAALGKACRNLELEHIDMRRNSINDSSIVGFVNNIMSSVVPVQPNSVKSPVVRLGRLNLERNQIGKAGAKAIGSLLNPKICALRMLDLDKNCLDDDGAICLAKSIAECESNDSLIFLNLRSNQIGNKGAVALFEHLPVCTALRTFLLDNNPISDDGCISFANKIIKHKALKNLSLRGCNIGDEGVISILSNLQKENTAHTDTNLASLDLFCDGNQITDSGARRIAPLLANLNPNITKLEFCIKTVEGYGTIVQEGLKHNYNLQKVRAGDHNSKNLNIQRNFYLRLNENGRKIMEISKNDTAYSYLWTTLLSKRSITYEPPSPRPTPRMMYYFLRENPDLFENVNNNKAHDKKSVQKTNLSGRKRKVLACKK